MPGTDLRQPVLGPLRAAADTAELARAEPGLAAAGWYRLAGSGPLARAVARSLTEAMNMAFGVILRAFAYPAGPFGAGRTWLVTGHCGQDPGAGR